MPAGKERGTATSEKRSSSPRSRSAKSGTLRSSSAGLRLSSVSATDELSRPSARTGARGRRLAAQPTFTPLQCGRCRLPTPGGDRCRPRRRSARGEGQLARSAAEAGGQQSLLVAGAEDRLAVYLLDAELR